MLGQRGRSLLQPLLNPCPCRSVAAQVELRFAVQMWLENGMADEDRAAVESAHRALQASRPCCLHFAHGAPRLPWARAPLLCAAVANTGGASRGPGRMGRRTLCRGAWGLARSRRGAAHPHTSAAPLCVLWQDVWANVVRLYPNHFKVRWKGAAPVVGGLACS